MRIKWTYALSVIVAAATLAGVMAMSTQRGATGQRTAQPRPMKLAVVDFTELSKQVDDFQLIEQMLQKLQTLATVWAESFQKQIQDVEENIETITVQMRNAPDNRTLELELRNLRMERDELRADAASAAEVVQFQATMLSRNFTTKLLRKILASVRSWSTGRYDAVWKVLGEPDSAELEALGEAGSLEVLQQVERAREVLFFDPARGNIDDITESVAANVNRRDNDVTPELNTAIQRIDRQIQTAQAGGDPFAEE
jgi:hypothetical protein